MYTCIVDSHHMELYSGSTGVCEMATVDNDGRRRRYKPGPKNGINDMGRSQEPLSNLHIELALKYMLDCHLYN